MPKLNRREAIGLGGKIGAGALGAYLGAEISSDPKAASSAAIEALLHKRVMDFTAEGHNYRAVYWAHGQGGYANGEIRPEDVVPGRFTILESSFEYLDPHFELSSAYSPDDRRSIRDNSLGIVLNDCPFNHLPGYVSEVSPLLVAVGLTITQPLLKRRDFLRKGAGLGAVLAGISGAKPLLSLLDFSPAMAKELARLNYFIELANPQSFISTFRNALVAYKTLDREQDHNIIFGKGHTSQPFYFQSGRSTLLDYLGRYPLEWIDQLVPDRQYLYTSLVQTKTDAGNYQSSLVEHPKLKQLFS